MDHDLPGQTKGGFLGQDPMPKNLVDTGHQDGLT